MYAIERTKIIKNYIEDHGQAQVQALSNLLNVSEVTVRRDLERLEAEGWLTRTHGGAVLNRSEEPDPLVGILEKQADLSSLEEISSIAMKMVSDGDVIMLSNGPINSTFAKMLDQRSGLTVLTNDLTIALRISMHESNKAVLLGGELDKTEKSVFGSMAISNFQQYFVNKLFMEVDGVSEDLQLSVSSQEKAILLQSAMEVTNETVVICNADRFSNNAFFRLGHMNIAQKIITNTHLDHNFKSKIFDADIPLFTSVSASEGSE